MRLIALALVAVSAAGSAWFLDQRSNPAAASVSAATVAPKPAASGSSATSIRKADDGHFWVDAVVEGKRVRFLVDTGASVVALTPADAKRLGYSEQRLTFDRPVNTAGGQIMAAGVTLSSVSVNGIVQRDVPALVVREATSHSLLGMSYLGRLSKIEATRDSLILRR